MWSHLKIELLLLFLLLSVQMQLIPNSSEILTVTSNSMDFLAHLSWIFLSFEKDNECAFILFHLYQLSLQPTSLS